MIYSTINDALAAIGGMIKIITLFIGLIFGPIIYNRLISSISKEILLENKIKIKKDSLKTTIAKVNARFTVTSLYNLFDQVSDLKREKYKK